MKQLLIFLIAIVAFVACNNQPVPEQETIARHDTLIPLEVETIPEFKEPVVVVDSGPRNPQHGKPDHRCEIAVGAPLSTAPPLK